GYIGHRETPAMLSQARLDECHTAGLKLTLVLFDEIEKANEALWQLLLGILDKGILTLGDNQQVDFSKSMVFMTSNLGSTEMQHAAEGPIGFVNNIGSSQENLTTIAINAARKRFSPESFVDCRNVCRKAAVLANKCTCPTKRLFVQVD